MNTKKLALNTALSLAALRGQFGPSTDLSADELIADAKKVEAFIFAGRDVVKSEADGKEYDLNQGQELKDANPLDGINPLRIPKGLADMVRKIASVKALQTQDGSPLQRLTDHVELMKFLGGKTIESGDLPLDVQDALCGLDIHTYAELVTNFTRLPGKVPTASLAPIYTSTRNAVIEAVDVGGVNDPEAVGIRDSFNEITEVVSKMSDMLNSVSRLKDDLGDALGEGCDCPACQLEARGEKLMPVPDEMLPPEIRDIVNYARSQGVEVGMAPVDLEGAPFGEMASALIMRGGNKEAIERVRKMVEKTLGN